MVNMRYCSEKNILNVELIGRIDFKEMSAYCEKISKDNNLPGSLRILEDATLAVFDFDIDKVDQINQIMVSQIAGNRIIIHALLRTEPISTAYGMISEMANNDPRYNAKVFSTWQIAMDWLQSR
ncbi:hypothetical protein GQR60_00020 [Labilibaculum sp. A4]|uniref:hypothetical protein n=1 Tax=Labilibaculum euxinus TaxID=2686357 RepID=UPI000FEED0DA|nr:hypothetical protein [Labilibaculum euxinus]MDQ1769200.1 hypothetical protein [Labilibaculum euxinus]MWN74724.1 hypothetical protein [Labilibaculum euxinus]